MPRDSLARLVKGVDRERAGRFSGSVPGRRTEMRQVCVACRRLFSLWQRHGDRYRERAAGGWFESWGKDGERCWARKLDDAYRYEYEPMEPEPTCCPSCGGAFMWVEGWQCRAAGPRARRAEGWRRRLFEDRLPSW